MEAHRHDAWKGRRISSLFSLLGSAGPVTHKDDGASENDEAEDDEADGEDEALENDEADDDEADEEDRQALENDESVSENDEIKNQAK